LREANHDAAFGCRQEMERIVKQLRTARPEVKIVLRGDSGFCRNELMSWCESQGVDFVFGDVERSRTGLLVTDKQAMAASLRATRNKRLRRIIGLQMHQATMQWNQTGRPERVFTEFLHSTKRRRQAAGTAGGAWRRRRCTKSCIVNEATWRTASKSSSACSPRREIVARFNGGTISSDGGAFLLRQVDKRLNLLARFGQCFLDGRNQALVEHSISEMVSQRVYGLALGYEDLNDHEQLRTDPVFGILAGKEDLTEPLAGKSTLNRMELGTGINSRYKKITFWKEAVDELLVNAFIESHQEAPAEIVLDNRGCTERCVAGHHCHHLSVGCVKHRAIQRRVA